MNQQSGTQRSRVDMHIQMPFNLNAIKGETVFNGVGCDALCKDQGVKPEGSGLCKWIQAASNNTSPMKSPCFSMYKAPTNRLRFTLD